ncbi:MAG: hypothetical protein ACLFO2_00905 [Candidatus Woesearchaeota archaeon]
MRQGRATEAIRLLFSTLLLLSIIPLASALDYQEGIHLIRPESKYITGNYAVPEYLTVEDLTFVSCLEEDHTLQNSLLCLDDNSFQDLEATPWSEQDNCYISSYNLQDFECERLVIQAEYLEEGEKYKITKRVRVNKLSKVLDKIVDNQYNDGGWRTPLGTAYAVWALSYFKDIYEYEIDLALDWLKMNRNDDEKCWPKSPCNIEQSARILSLLTLSNYTDAKRVVNDARNWLEQLQNYYQQGDTWSAVVEAVNNETTLTLVAYEKEILDENFTLPLHGTKDYEFPAETGKELIIISDDNIIVNITNQEDETLITYQGDNLSYHVPGPCWSLNRKGEGCDPTTSIYAMTSPIDEDRAEAAEEWAVTQIRDGDILGRYFGDGEEKVTDTSYFMYNIHDRSDAEDYLPDIRDWLLYVQNNEGSWGDDATSEKMVLAAQAVLALTSDGYNRTDEPIEDAEEWASDHEDDLEENQTVALGSAFFILKHNARPLLVTTPKVIVVDQPEVTVEVFNPTMFDLEDLTYEFSEALEEDLAIERREEIDAYSYRRLDVSRRGESRKQGFGFLTISNMDEPVAKIPVILADAPTFNASVPDTVTVFGKSADLQVPVQKSPHTFVCSASWDSQELSTPGSVRVTSSTFDLPLEFSTALTQEDVYEGELSCTAAGKTLEQDISVHAKRYADVPLTVSPTDVIVNNTEDDVSFTVKNNLDRDLPVDLSLDRYDQYFSFPASVTLSPNEERNVSLKNNLPSDLNLTSTVLLDFEVFDRGTTATILVDVVERPPEQKSLLAALLPLIIILVFVSVAGFFAWKYRDALIAELNKLNVWRVREEKKKETSRIQSLKQSEQRQAIVNLLNIMKFQNKDEKEIAQRLLSKFDREDIKAALEEAGIALPAIDEDEPEKA